MIHSVPTHNNNREKKPFYECLQFLNRLCFNSVVITCLLAVVYSGGVCFYTLVTCQLLPTHGRIIRFTSPAPTGSAGFVHANSKTRLEKPVRLYRFRRIFFFFLFSSTSQWMIVARSKVWQIVAPGLRKRRVTMPKWTAKWEMERRSQRAASWFTAAVFPHVVTGPDGPSAALETLGRVCETPTDKHKDSQECRQNSNLLLITYIFFTFVREVCGRKTASSGKDASAGGLQGATLHPSWQFLLKTAFHRVFISLKRRVGQSHPPFCLFAFSSLNPFPAR